MNPVIIYSLGMTLLHSLWQIVLIYLILKLLLLRLKNSESRIRYNLSGIAMIFSLLIAGITFSIYFNHQQSILSNAQTSLTIADPGIITGYLRANAEEVPAGNFSLEIVLPYLVIFYISGVVLFALKLTGSLIYLRKYTRKGILPVDEKLEKIFTGIVNSFSLTKKIRIFESVLTKVPMVIGYLKPVVIVPAGFLTHLPYNQLEAILAHELAHIKRNDYLINILQSVVELLFFYHPVIYLISRCMREERENCCDDIALQFCRDSGLYLKALANIQNAYTSYHHPAVAFAGKKKVLLNRMNRILKLNYMKTRNSDKLIAGTIILAGIFTIFLTSAAALNNLSGKNSVPLENEYEQGVRIENHYTAATEADTIIDYDTDRVITHRKSEEGKNEKIEMTFSNGKLTLLKVNDKVIPEGRYKEYRDIIKDTRAEVKQASLEVTKAEQELDALDEQEIEREVERALEEARELNEEEIERELEKAKRELEEIDREEIRREVEDAISEAQRELEQAGLDEINMDSLRLAIDIAMNSLDWEEIKESVRIALEEAEISKEEMEQAMLEVNKAMQEVDWNQIQASIDEGLEAARSSLEAIQWDAIMESIDISLDITSDVLRNIGEEIEISLKEMNEIDVKADIEEARKHVKAEKDKLNELDKNMEKALEELEKK